MLFYSAEGRYSSGEPMFFNHNETNKTFKQMVRTHPREFALSLLDIPQIKLTDNITGRIPLNYMPDISGVSSCFLVIIARRYKGRMKSSDFPEDFIKYREEDKRAEQERLEAEQKRRLIYGDRA